MSRQLRTTRRKMLALTGSLAVAGLAGCSESSGQPGSGGADTPTASETHDDHTEAGSHDEDGSHTEDGGHDGGGSHDHGTELPSEPSPSVEVTMKTEGGGHHFSPHVAWVQKGGTVTWHLESGTHNAVAYHPDNDRPRRMPEGAEPWEAKLLSDSGSTVTHTFDTEGVYDYYCAPHESLGMVGTVIVGRPDAHEQPGLAEPQQSLPDGARTELQNLNEKVNQALGHTH